MRAPQAPHSLAKVRVKMAVEDGIAHRLVAIAAAVVGHFQCEGGAGANGLAVIVAAVIVVWRVHPLMCVLVMDVMFIHPAMQNAELGVVRNVTVINVGRIVRIKHLGSFRSGDHCSVRVTGVRGDIHDLRGIANGPRAEEKFLILALSAIGFRSDFQPVGQNFRSDASHTIVDSKAVNRTVQREAKSDVNESLDRNYFGIGWIGRTEKLRKRLYCSNLVMVHDSELAERLFPVRQLRIFEECICGKTSWLARSTQRPGDHRRQI
jgi:hypothetical protein